MPTRTTRSSARSLPRAVRVVTHRRANAGELAGRDRRAGAASAHDDAAVGLAVTEGLRDGFRNVGVVDRRRAVGAEVDDLVPGHGEVSRQIAFHLKTGVIGPDCNAHGEILQVLGSLGSLGS